MSETAKNTGQSTGQPLSLDLKDDGAFPVAREADWRALVDTALRGADLEKRLYRKTADGFAVRPLYGPGERTENAGLPGQMPFTRGSQAASDLTRPWGITLRVDEPDLAKANAIILEGLEGGVSHLDLVLADHTQAGLPLSQASDFETLLKGVDTKLISISMTGGEETGMTSGQMARYAGPKNLTGCISYDPLGALATRGGLVMSLDEALGMAGMMAAQTDKMTDTFRSMNVDMRGLDAAGASPALSLAIAMSTGVAYLKALEAADMSMDAAAKHIVFTLTSDTDLFLSIAKLRAARKLWSRVVTASGGAPGAAAMALNVETATSMMAQRDAHTNILRTAIAGFGAAIGGANAISILPFTHAIGLPDELARRIARNIHVLLAEESNLGRVMDPAGGSFALEQLTGDVASAAWDLFQQIEADGGMAAALQSGWVQKHITALNEARMKDLATRKLPVTGVSEFPDIAEAPVSATPRKVTGDAPRFSIEVEALKPQRLAEPFETLRDRADAAPKRPSVFLANIGSLAAYTARASFARNFFEAGGFDVIDSEGGTDIPAISDAFAKSGAAIACLCSSDPLYAEHAVAVAKALGGKSKLTFLAGSEGDLKEPLAEAGVTDFIFMGANVLEALEKAQSAAGV